MSAEEPINLGYLSLPVETQAAVEAHVGRKTTVHEQVTEYRVCAGPLDDDHACDWSLTVAWRGNGQWAVLKGSRLCLGADGEWDWEPLPSSREDDWLATHRFDRETALRLARQAAPKVTVNGMTWAQWQERVWQGAQW